jgi:DNA-directed RNA polymerase specialized sigma24 family protein
MTTRGNALAAGDRTDEPRGIAAFREHGPVVARVCMALLGDASASERALERVAAEVGSARFEAGQDLLVRLLGMARVACSNQLSKLPIRSTSAGLAPSPADSPAALARAELGRLKPTEREAVVLHVVGGLDAAQVAEACGIDLTTARTRIARGVSQLVEQEKQR